MGVNGTEGAAAGTKTVTVMEIHPNFKTVTVTVIFGKSILKNNKTAGNNFDLNGTAVRAEIITEIILERVGPVVFKTSLLELIAFRLIPVICPARLVKPENYWKR